MSTWLDPSQYNPNDECPICYDEYGTTQGVYMTECNHIFHNDCLYDLCKLSATGLINCPLCRTELSTDCDDVYGFKHGILESSTGEPLFNGNKYILDIYNENNRASKGGKRNKKVNKTKKIKNIKRKVSKNKRTKTKRRERR